MAQAVQKQKTQKCIDPVKGAFLKRLYNGTLSKREENQLIRHYKLCKFCKEADQKLYYSANKNLNRGDVGHPSVPREIIRRAVHSVLEEDRMAKKPKGVKV